jgi:hypothetical protein
LAVNLATICWRSGSLFARLPPLTILEELATNGKVDKVLVAALGLMVRT